MSSFGEPGRSASPASTRVPRRAKRNAERSCIVCHRRKVRCDKNVPCANCTRAGVLCCYPSHERRPRQPKATIADIASRLVQLERTIVAVSGGDGGDEVFEGDGPAEKTAVAASKTAGVLAPQEADRRATSSSNSPPSDAHTNGEDDSGAGAEDLLLKNAYTSRYINEILMSRVLEEEHEIKSVLSQHKESEPGSEDGPTPVATPPLTLFGTITGRRGLQHQASRAAFHPSRHHATVLWQFFTQNVDPLNKLLHVPTVEIDVFTAINHPETTPAEMDSLLFSIYFSTATSFQPDEYKALFGEDKTAAQARFREGLELSLAQANFLESPTLLTLQALALLLRAARASSAGRAIWILDGMTIRAAQSIGMHRDGSKLHLSPFESEIRRRVWWHIITQDARAAEDHGLAVSTLDLSSDIRFPLNVSDADLSPAMTELPPPSPRWTEMTLSVCMFRLSYCMQELNRVLEAPSPTEARRVEILRERTAYVEELLEQCNPVVPLQRLTKLMIGLVQLKFQFVSRLQLATVMQAHAEGGRGRAPHATEENLVAACEMLELHLQLLRDEMLQNYRWLCELYPQYHTILYMLWHLCVQPGGPHIERAWAAVDGVFAIEALRLQRQGVPVKNPKWELLVALRDKARRVRSSAQQPGMGAVVPGAADAAEPPDAAAGGPVSPQTLQAAASLPLLAQAPVQADLADADMLSFLGDDWSEDFMDWNAVANDFRAKTYDFI